MTLKGLLPVYTLILMLMLGCARTEQAGLLIYGGTVYPTADSARAVEALAVKDGKVLATGTEEELRKVYRFDKEINLNGAFAYPGFMDAHSHFIGLAEYYLECDLFGTTSPADVLDRLVSWAKEHPKGWVVGRGWDQNDWPEQQYPAAAMLDSLFPERPVYLVRVDGHAAWVNGAVKKTFGITAGMNVPGGEVLTDGGILLDGALDLVEVPDPAPDDLLEALKKAESFCYSLGLTGIADCGLSPAELRFLRTSYAEGALSIPLYAMASDDDSCLVYLKKHAPLAEGNFTLRAMKAYADGALGSRGALLLEPYTDRHEHYGLPVRSKEWIENRASEIAELNLQLCVHAIGDSANREVLHIMEAYPNRRWRIEHAQVVHPDDRSLFGSAGIIPSVQPTHATSDAPWAADRLGERIGRGYSYQSLLQAAGLLALGTDFPIEHPDPGMTFYAAVERKNGNGLPPGGFLPSEALTRSQALRGMTEWVAWSQFEEKRKGTLLPGREANLTVLTHDLFSAPAQELVNNPVKMTILQGVVKYPVSDN